MHPLILIGNWLRAKNEYQQNPMTFTLVNWYVLFWLCPEEDKKGVPYRNGMIKRAVLAKAYSSMGDSFWNLGTWNTLPILQAASLFYICLFLVVQLVWASSKQFALYLFLIGCSSGLCFFQAVGLVWEWLSVVFPTCISLRLRRAYQTYQFQGLPEDILCCLLPALMRSPPGWAVSSTL